MTRKLQKPSIAFICLVVVIWFCPPATSQVPDLAGPVVKEVSAAFEAWIGSYKRGDKDGFMNYLWKSEDFIVLTRSGEIVRGWENFRKIIQAGSSGSTAEFQILTVIPLLADSAVLIYTAAEAGEKDPLKITRGTMVWNRKPEGWRCVNFQFARPEPPSVPAPAITLPTLPPPATREPPHEIGGVGRRENAKGAEPRSAVSTGITNSSIRRHRSCTV